MMYKQHYKQILMYGKTSVYHISKFLSK